MSDSNPTDANRRTATDYAEGSNSLRPHTNYKGTDEEVTSSDRSECPNGKEWCLGPDGLTSGYLSCFACWLDADEEEIAAYDDADETRLSTPRIGEVGSE